MCIFKRCALILVSMSLLLVSASCTEGDRGASTTGATGDRQYMPGRGSDENRALAERVEKALRADPALADAPNVAVETSDGEVTLGGSAPNEDRAKRAIEIARGIEGVKNVQDEIVRESKVGVPATLHQSTTSETPPSE